MTNIRIWLRSHLKKISLAKMPFKLLIAGISILIFPGCLPIAPPDSESGRRASQLIDQGTEALRHGDLDRAEAAFSVSAELFPRPAAIDGLGCVALLRGENERAERFFNAALEADFGYTEALGNLALLYEQWGKPDKAREYYLRAISADPGNFRVRNNYGVFLAHCEISKDCDMSQEYGTADSTDVRQQLLRAAVLQDSEIIGANLERVTERE